MLLVCVIFQLLCIAKFSDAKQYPDWVIRSGASFDDTSPPTMRMSTNLATFADVAEEEYKNIYGGTDGEKIDLLEKFFWGMEYGTIIELGALDGGKASHSQSELFENFHWKRVLLEGNPTHRDGLMKHVNAFSANIVVCKQDMVHYAIGHVPMASGIVEFMAPTFMGQFHKTLYKEAGSTGTFNVSSINWNSDRISSLNILKVPCVSIDKVLTTIGLTHVNAFILDVEGAETDVLESIDFSRVKFDVLVIEKNHHKRILNFFENHPEYVHLANRGRNFWYKHVDFVPSSRPGVDKNCYRGAVKAGIPGANKGNHCKKD